MRVTYEQPNGERAHVEARRGDSVMHAAVSTGVNGIVADCRGGLTCSTCHVFVDESWIERTGSAEQDELDMLEFAAVPAEDNSRLSCQIILTEDLDGLVVRVPEAQE